MDYVIPISKLFTSCWIGERNQLTNGSLRSLPAGHPRLLKHQTLLRQRISWIPKNIPFKHFSPPDVLLDMSRVWIKQVNSIFQMLHGTAIFTYTFTITNILYPNVGKYSSPMEDILNYLFGFKSFGTLNEPQFWWVLKASFLGCQSFWPTANLFAV